MPATGVSRLHKVMRTPFITCIAVMLWITLTGCPSRGSFFVPVAGGGSQDSTIYFYRPYSGSLNSPPYEITESGTHVGMLTDGGYFVLGASPGVHQYAVAKAQAAFLCMRSREKGIL
jgi:hypothetical protein